MDNNKINSCKGLIEIINQMKNLVKVSIKINFNKNNKIDIF